MLIALCNILLSTMTDEEITTWSCHTWGVHSIEGNSMHFTWIVECQVIVLVYRWNLNPVCCWCKKSSMSCSIICLVARLDSLFVKGRLHLCALVTANNLVIRVWSEVCNNFYPVNCLAEFGWGEREKNQRVAGQCFSNELYHF